MDTSLGNRSPLELGSLVALVALGLAAILGVIAVLDADAAVTGFGTGFGVAFTVFLSGATIVCALACLARGKAAYVALGSIVVTGIALDLLVLAILLDIDSEAYGKTVAAGLAWSFFALIALGLMLAVDRPAKLAHWAYLGGLISTATAGLITTYLIATAGGGGEFPDAVPTDAGSVTSPVGIVDVGDDEMLRVLGLLLVLLAAFWFGAIAASRLERATAAGA
jgi:hypothetical protein